MQTTPQLAQHMDLSHDARRRVVLIRRDDREYLVLLSPHGDTILDSDIEVQDIPEAPLSGSTFVTIKTEPRL